jgi:hypothetical protein
LSYIHVVNSLIPHPHPNDSVDHQKKIAQTYLN